MLGPYLCDTVHASCLTYLIYTMSSIFSTILIFTLVYYLLPLSSSLGDYCIALSVLCFFYLFIFNASAFLQRINKTSFLSEKQLFVPVFPLIEQIFR